MVGSNIFNLLFVLGTTATIHRVPVPADGTPDLVAMLAFAAALLVFALRGQVGRVHGILFLAGYVGYVAWRAA